MRESPEYKHHLPQLRGTARAARRFQRCTNVCQISGRKLTEQRTDLPGCLWQQAGALCVILQQLSFNFLNQQGT